MAWPYDAVIRVYSALKSIFSDDLNELQERIVDLHRDRYKVLRNGQAGPYDSWHIENGTNGWLCLNAAGELRIPIELPAGAVIKAVAAKHYNASGGAAAASVILYSADAEFDAAATAPGLSAALATLSFTQAATTWDVQSATGLTQSCTDQKIFHLTVSGCAVNDRICAVRVLYQPLTATP